MVGVEMEIYVQMWGFQEMDGGRCDGWEVGSEWRDVLEMNRIVSF